MRIPRPKAAKYLVWAGSMVLAATAAFHGSGWPDVAAAVDETPLSQFLGAVVKGLWLYASYHWFFVAVLAAVAAAHPSRLARIVLALSATVLAADVVLLLVAVGPFLGEALLAVSSVTYTAGAFSIHPADLTSPGRNAA